MDIQSAGAHKGYEIDLTHAHWRKSTRSGAYGDNCVEVAFIDGAIAVRDSKDRNGKVLLFTRIEWEVFISGVRDGEFEQAK